MDEDLWHYLSVGDIERQTLDNYIKRLNTLVSFHCIQFTYPYGGVLFAWEVEFSFCL